MNNTKYFAQLFYSSDDGYTETNSVKQAIQGYESEIEFNIEDIDNLKSLRFDPINDYCILEIDSLQVLLDDGSWITLDYSGNYGSANLPLFVFSTGDPNLFVRLPNITSKFITFKASLKFLAISEHSVNTIERKLVELEETKEKLNNLSILSTDGKSDESIIQQNYLLQSRLADLNDELTYIENQHNSIEQNKIIQSLSNIELLNTTLNSRISSQEARFTEFQETISQKEGKISSLEETIDVLNKQIVSLSMKEAELNASLSEIKENQESYIVIAKNSKTLIDKYSAQKSSALKKLKKLKTELLEVDTVLQHKSSELNLLRNELTTLQRDRNQLQEQVNHTTQQIASIQHQLYDKEIHIKNIEGFLRQRDEVLAYMHTYMGSALHELNFLKDYIKKLNLSKSYRLGFGLTAPLRYLVGVPDHSKLKEIVNREHPLPQIPEPVLKIAEPELEKPQEQEVEATYVTLDEQMKSDLLRGNVSQTKRNVLFISPHLPDYDTSSGGRRATLMLELLAEEFNVYIYTLGDKPLKYINKLEEVGVTVLKGPAFSEIDIHTYEYPEIPLQVDRIDCIIYAWYTTYYQSKHIMRLYPKATVVFDSVDVHWVREERLIGIDDHHTTEGVQQNKLNEVHAYNQGKILWAVTEEDRQHLLEEIPSADVRVVSNVHDIEVEDYKDNGANRILFFGGYKHTPNISAIKKLCIEILPKIRAEVPDATVVIAGSHAPQDIIDLGKLDGVEYKGFIEDEDLHALYEYCTITVVPLLAGAGIKGKICEAVAHKLPVVTNSIGNEGIFLEHGVEGMITDDYDLMADHAIALLKRQYDLSDMTSKAQDRLNDLVGPEEVKRRMVECVAPMVSICIVTWNRLHLVKRCIESIIRNTTYPRYRILVHSNGCSDGTQAYLTEAAKADSRIIPILSDTNEVFVKPNNAMMAMYPGDDVVLVNNDTYLNEGWLEELQKTAYCRKNTGIVGSKILYPDGSLQEFGSELYANYSGNNRGKHQNPNNPEYQSIQEVGYVSGCSMYITQQTLAKVGMFDTQFHPCYCEDSDLSYSAWEYGIETVVTPYSTIYHDEGGTSGTSTESGFKAFQDVNFHKFYLKHRGKINRINWGLDKITNTSIEEELLKEFKSQLGRLILNGTQRLYSYTTTYQDNKVYSYREYKRYLYKMTPIYNKRFIIEKNLVQHTPNQIDFKGYNAILDDYTTYSISNQRDQIIRGIALPNYREELYCPLTKTNSRIRATVLKTIDTLAQYGDKASVAYNGLDDGFADFLRKKTHNPAFYEWTSDQLESIDSLETYGNNALKANSIDLSIETEQLHLVPDYNKALQVQFDILKPGGTLILTMPFLVNSKNTIQRVTIDEVTDEVVHLEHPIYFKHSSKNQDKLCHQLFGWDLLDSMQEIGFETPHASFTWSLYHGILGMDIMVIVATKPL